MREAGGGVPIRRHAQYMRALRQPPYLPAVVPPRHLLLRHEPAPLPGGVVRQSCLGHVRVQHNLYVRKAVFILPTKPDRIKPIYRHADVDFSLRGALGPKFRLHV
eukprot:CAMPEP_0173169858 /NCGR_PEP_ID=MMETSP1141-20130122/931_1 /TAXON_ID=483371 /ORGANISM="non described non described, Strain CCMP2298" /LENGTH=104 /DNA_ID=CAMNT_0014091719 /DNA_START=472 /DNA_END=786 /DNA_ORIENTATION=-